MTRDFDKLITDAAPSVPDCGRSRRTARALMHERMRRDVRCKRTRDLRGTVLAASLVFLVVLGGQVTELGSDAFEFEISTLDLGNGETVPYMTSKVRGKIGSALPGMNQDDMMELQQQTFLREGTIEFIFAYSFNGETPWWNISYLMEVNGEVVHLARDPLNLSVPSRPPDKDKMPFLANHMDDFMALLDSGRIAPKPYGTVTSDGLTFKVQQYSKEYPEWGVFTFLRGYPVDQ